MDFFGCTLKRECVLGRSMHFRSWITVTVGLLLTATVGMWVGCGGSRDQNTPNINTNTPIDPPPPRSPPRRPFHPPYLTPPEWSTKPTTPSPGPDPCSRGAPP